MATIARILGVSLLTGAIGAVAGYAVGSPASDWPVLSLALGCTGAILGAIAGAAGEVVGAQRRAGAR